MKYSLSQSGFSLVETLVAITILLVIIVGPLTLVSTSARSTNFASEQVTAFFLAQEGVELAQKARDDIMLRRFLPTNDTNYLADPWNQATNGFASATNGPFASCYLANGCGLTIGTATNAPISAFPCTGTACKVYLYDTDTRESGQLATPGRSRYSYSPTNSVATPFTRVVTFSNMPGGNQVRVVSTVTWYTGSVNTQQSVAVESYLFNIYAN